MPSQIELPLHLHLHFAFASAFAFAFAVAFAFAFLQFKQDAVILSERAPQALLSLGVVSEGSAVALAFVVVLGCCLFSAPSNAMSSSAKSKNLPVHFMNYATRLRLTTLE
jgi:hypothetical protein